MEALADKAKTSPGAIRPFEGNRIRYIIESKVDEQRNDGLRDTLRERICKALNISKRYTQMLNNLVQPSLEDATAIAQILEVSVDELCILAPEEK